MENYEWKKASEKLEEAIREFEIILLEIKLSHGKMKIEILKSSYSFEKKEHAYKKRINELEEQLNDKKFEFEYPPILGYPPIIDVEVE
ncbi:hypothetical protein [Aliarcobacter butzleri]|uniref:hypothetical protein n=1 Tax=Aliarcobacter butzleri TaxID=28197 RepID=UPI00125ED757|nr:hypothetical protein [Aliarcobacter butzleri]MDK2065238.1 hypothetical protein [Aliarcobacter butzleri]